MRGQSIAYLLRLLEDHEQAAFEAQLEADAALAADLELLRRALELFAADSELLVPPADLAERTCLDLLRGFQEDESNRPSEGQ